MKMFGRLESADCRPTGITAGIDEWRPSGDRVFAILLPTYPSKANELKGCVLPFLVKQPASILIDPEMILPPISVSKADELQGCILDAIFGVRSSGRVLVDPELILLPIYPYVEAYQ